MSEPRREPDAASEKALPCPICRRPSDTKLRPFCSKRCADVDLGRWFTESYRVPARQDPESDEEDMG